MTQQPSSEREEFEKWADEQGWGNSGPFRRQMFQVWKASREAITPVLEGAQKSLECASQICRVENWPENRKNIEASIAEIKKLLRRE